VFNVLNYCLDKKEGYTFGFALNGSILGVMFDAKIGGVLSVSFAITLEEVAVLEETVTIFKQNNMEADLAITKEELANTKEELANTKEEMYLIKEELVVTNEQLAEVKRNQKATDAYMYELSTTVVILKEQLKKVRDDYEVQEDYAKKLATLEPMIRHLMDVCAINFATTNPGWFHNLTYPDINRCVGTPYGIYTKELRFGYTKVGGELINWSKLELLPSLVRLTISGFARFGFYKHAKNRNLQHLTICDGGVVSWPPETNMSRWKQPHTFGWILNFPNLVSIDTKEVPGLTGLIMFLPECPKLKRIRIYTASTALIRYCVAHGIDLEYTPLISVDL
jgi:hypothetical protein